MADEVGDNVVAETLNEGKGVISINVDDTNRLRARLGLKPLKSGKHESQIKTREIIDLSKDSKPTVTEVRQRIETSRVRRQREELHKPPSLVPGDDDVTVDNSLDAKAWVSKMRRVDGKKRKRKKENDDAYNAYDFSSSARELRHDMRSAVEVDAAAAAFMDLKVMHKASQLKDLRAGQEVVLTLKDRRLINEAGRLDETEDVIENLDLAKETLREKRKNETSKINKSYSNRLLSTYNPFEDDGDTVTIRASTANVLPHYDDWAVEAKMVPKPIGFDTMGAIPLKDFVGEKEEECANKEGIDLTSQVKYQHDFMTTEEFEEAAKKKKTTTTKRVKSIRRRQLEGEGEETTKTVERFNPEIRIPSRQQEVEEAENVDDAALYEKLARKRREVLQNNSLAGVKTSVMDAVNKVKKIEEMKEKIEKGEIHHNNNNSDGIQSVGLIDVKEEEDVGFSSSKLSLVELTSTKEFCRVLETPMATLHQKTDHKRGIEYSTSDVAGVEKSWRCGVEDENVELKDEEEDSGIGDEANNDDALPMSETRLDEGLISALEILKSRGDLSDDPWRLGRHSSDDKPLHQSTNKADIRIEYKDEFGRVLGPKDAFRNISWAFHGKGPGKKKREKLLRQIENEKKMRTAGQNSHLLPTVQALKKQQKLGTAHLVLSSSSTI